MYSVLLLSTVLIAQAAPDAVPTGLTITVQKLPANYAQAPVVHLELTDKGAVASCAVKQSSGNPAIDKVACQQAQAQVKFPVKRKQKLNPMDMTVTFVPAAPAK
jgi:TonB family protein